MSKGATKASGGVWESTSANEMLVTGAALGAFGTASTLLASAVCPVCMVGAPLLLGAGVYKKIREKRAANDSAQHSPPAPETSDVPQDRVAS